MAQTAIYRLQSQYTSPAEGGCYRTIGELVRVIYTGSKEEAWHRCRRVNRLLEYRRRLYRRNRHYSDYYWHEAKAYEAEAPQYYASGSAYYE